MEFAKNLHMLLLKTAFQISSFGPLNTMKAKEIFFAKWLIIPRYAKNCPAEKKLKWASKAGSQDLGNNF